jgi:hypothetical protein
MECWTEEPNDRPSFDEIVDQLREMKMKAMPNANSWKLKLFIKDIEGLAIVNLTVRQ